MGQIDIPDALNVIAVYPIAPVKESKHAELAQAFIDLVLSQEGQEVAGEVQLHPAKVAQASGFR